VGFRTSTQAKAAAHTSWARTVDRAARTAKAREAALANLEAVVDPDHKMSDADRRKAAVNAHKARLYNASQKGVDTRRRQRAKAKKRAGDAT
jgi:Skp family chaperone for outer membrane proteins